jgi:hypothetical protein
MPSLDSLGLTSEELYNMPFEPSTLGKTRQQPFHLEN